MFNIVKHNNASFFSLFVKIYLHPATWIYLFSIQVKIIMENEHNASPILSRYGLGLVRVIFLGLTIYVLIEGLLPNNWDFFGTLLLGIGS
jgi:hypothetical protein